MWTPIDGAFDGSHISRQEIMQAVGPWRWGFADLPDDGIKCDVAEVIVKVLLGVDPTTMSPKELQVLSMCNLAAPGEPAMRENGVAFDT